MTFSCLPYYIRNYDWMVSIAGSSKYEISLGEPQFLHCRMQNRQLRLIMTFSASSSFPDFYYSEPEIRE